MFACQEGHCEVVNMLLDAGVNKDAANKVSGRGGCHALDVLSDAVMSLTLLLYDCN